MSRMEYYFLAFQVVTVPIVYGKIRDKTIRLGVSAIYIFLLFIGYYRFFFVTEWSSTTFKYFHTIFDVLF